MEVKSRVHGGGLVVVIFSVDRMEKMVMKSVGSIFFLRVSLFSGCGTLSLFIMKKITISILLLLIMGFIFLF